MLGIRQKLSLGFCGLFTIVLIIGIQSVTLLSELGGATDVILRENYRSVIACQEMKEALERMDSGVLFEFLGYRQEGDDLIRRNRAAFEKALETELYNVTLPGEGEKAERIQKLFRKYAKAVDSATDVAAAPDVWKETYFSEVLPLFQRIKATAEDVLEMNHRNMIEANERARNTAAAARRRMIGLLFAGALVAVGFMLFVGKWILHPIARLIESANEIKSGNLDLVVRADSRDEIGALSEAFNSMAERLRELRRTDRAKLIRVQRSTEQAFKFLPDVVAIVDMDGNVEVASGAAIETFGLMPNESITRCPFQRVVDLFHEAVRTGRVAESRNGQSLLQRFVKGEERYFRPKAVPIVDSEKQLNGIIVILSDATQERYQQELKKGVISTVAHQLRSPLTSVRMALHLLLEEKVGLLTEKQVELIIAAREDSERLYSILEQLLHISRIEAGKGDTNRRTVSSRLLVLESVEPFGTSAHDRGVRLEVNLPELLPDVIADPALIAQVFANLISNALKYTNPGGSVTVSVQATDDEVIFSVADTGRGIPSQYLQKILEQFFQVPGQETGSGAGLGLSIVQEIVVAHGGTVNVESTEGVGSTFSFSLTRTDTGFVEESHGI